MDLPAGATRDDIQAAMAALPEDDIEGRNRLFERFVAAPPRPGIKWRHGGKPGSAESWQDGRWRPS